MRSTPATGHNGNKKGYSQLQVVQLMLLSMILTLFVARPPSRLASSTHAVSTMNIRAAGNTTKVTGFDTASATMYNKILQGIPSQKRNSFVLKDWKQKTTGGLWDEDRVLLARYYRNAESVFEYGLGESTLIANHVGVPRYAGIDSDVAWVDGVRQNVSSHFRFYYGDLGDIGEWGMPVDPKLPKSVWQYQMAPLQSELLPFDVYMVDGRYRVACVLLSFLHASARGADPLETTVLMHDCDQPGHSPPNWHQTIGVRQYTVNDDILQLHEHSGKSLCVYQRKPSTTDAMLLERYEKYVSEVG